MALNDKDILITPNKGQTADPKIEFKGADASTGAQTITLNVYPTDNGTLSFEGSAGQLFSITNDLSGTIFSVNDVSGIPSIEVLDTGEIKLAEYGGSVTVGGTFAAKKINTVIISSNTFASTGGYYVATASLTLTLPASPTTGDIVGFSNQSGTLTCVIARNGSNILGLAEDLTIDADKVSIILQYSDATRGWVFA